MAEKEICCPKFDPTPWDEKEITWQNKMFVKDIVRSFLHIPMNMGKVITRMSKAIDDAGAKVAEEDFLLLSLEDNQWKSEQYMAVTKEVPGMENVKISGTFLTKVFEGPYKEAKNWYNEMIGYVKSKGKEPKKIYFYYTTCPKCAKKYGKNYVVMIAQV
jgi:effector-binding domain-containing protein